MACTYNYVQCTSVEMNFSLKTQSELTVGEGGMPDSEHNPDNLLHV